MVINTPKKTWLLHFYYNKSMVVFLKGDISNVFISELKVCFYYGECSDELWHI